MPPWRTARFLIPPGRDASYAAAMELILDTYAAPPDPAVPLICFDAAGKELQADVRAPLPLRPGDPAREDPEYVRAGSANLFTSYAPHLGWRHVSVTAQRTAVDWAHAMRGLVDAPEFRDAAKLIVVLDNLNTHRLSSLYTAFPAPKARRIARKLDLRFTPKHGSWRNMAELELAVLGRQCLDRRLPGPRDAGDGRGGLDRRPERGRRPGPLDLHRRGCPDPPDPSLPHSSLRHRSLDGPLSGAKR